MNLCSANGLPAVGTLQTSPDRARVPMNQQQIRQVIWTVPEGKVWRDLNTIGLRICSDARTVLWVPWNETDDTFRLCRRPQGPRSHRDDDDDDVAALISAVPHDGCSAGALGGSPTALETDSARLHLASTRAQGSGPAGRQVTLSMAISFEPRALGEHRIELAPSDDFDAVDMPARVGRPARLSEARHRHACGP